MPAVNRSSRFSRWRRTHLVDDLEAPTELGQIPAESRITQKPSKHRSLDPGSPKYVLPDSQRWYDTDRKPRAPYDGRREISRESSKDGDVGLMSPRRVEAKEHEHRHGQECDHRHDHDHEHDHDHDHTHSHNHDHGHTHGHSHANLGFAGVILHLIGDAINSRFLLPYTPDFQTL